MGLTVLNFQFHFGTIKSDVLHIMLEGVHRPFNSTLVRLKVPDGCDAARKIPLSIPLWYD